MGKPGPRPTPTETKRRRGSPHRSKHDREPKPRRWCPQAPSHLNPDAKKLWPRLVRILDSMGLMTLADKGIVERYLETYVVWKEAMDSIAGYGIVAPVKKWNSTVKNPDGSKGAMETVAEKERPQVKIAARYANLLVVMERELGLSPSARTRIEVDNAPKQGVGRPPGSKKDIQTRRQAAGGGPRLTVLENA